MEAFLSDTVESRLVITVCGETDLGNAGDLLLRLVVLAGTAPPLHDAFKLASGAQGH